ASGSSAFDAGLFPGADPGLLQDAAEADPEIAPLAPGERLLGARGLVVRRRERLLERGAIVATVVDGLLAQRRAAHLVGHLGGIDEVTAPDVGRSELERRRHAVDQPLADERALVPSGPAIGPGRRLVGHHAERLRLVR